MPEHHPHEGVDLVANDPETAEVLLRDTLTQLDVAAAAGISSSIVRPLRAQAIAGLERSDEGGV